MSLLMDALKQAEANQGVPSPKTGNHSPVELALAPDPPPTPAARPKPVAASTDMPSRAPRRSPAQIHAAARALFEGEPAPRRPQARHLALGGLAVLLTGAGYLAGHTPGLFASTSTPQARGQQTPPQADPIPAVPLEVSPPPLPPVQTARDSVPADKPPAPQSRKAPAPAPGPQAQPSHMPPVVPLAPGQALLDAAHAAYSNGNLPQARHLLHEAREQAPMNTDIHLALGMIALRNAEPGLAEQHFRTLLEIDPMHPAARSQIVLLHAAADPVRGETRLRQLLTEQPESADALFALGSLLAGLERWQEAQQAFFKAHVLDGGKPDTLYNLAVSLDHLQQPGPARHYYQQALARSSGRAVAFDPDAALRRVIALTQLTR